MEADSRQSSVELPENQLLRCDESAIDRGQTVALIIGVVATICLLGSLSSGNPTGLISFSTLGLIAAIGWRYTQLGLVIESQGVTGRMLLRSHHWSWQEIDCFELRRTVYSPALLVKLRNGRSYGAVGFVSRNAKQHQRASEIFEQLNKRLAIERGLPYVSAQGHTSPRSFSQSIRGWFTDRI